jgi:hypothetical protein
MTKPWVEMELDRVPPAGGLAEAIRYALGRWPATAKLNDVEPFAYVQDVLERMSNGHPMSKLDDLLPWNWAPLNLTGV